MCRVMRDLGFAVIEAADGGEALLRIKQTRPELLVTDCQMPGTDGIRLVRALRGSGMTMPIIMISGVNDAVITRIAREAGVNHFLTKPVEFHELRECLRQVLGRLPNAA